VTESQQGLANQPCTHDAAAAHAALEQQLPTYWLARQQAAGMSHMAGPHLWHSRQHPALLESRAVAAAPASQSTSMCWKLLVDVAVSGHSASTCAHLSVGGGGLAPAGVSFGGGGPGKGGLPAGGSFTGIGAMTLPRCANMIGCSPVLASFVGGTWRSRSVKHDLCAVAPVSGTDVGATRSARSQHCSWCNCQAQLAGRWRRIQPVQAQGMCSTTGMSFVRTGSSHNWRGWP
jgi:hypothetical protein